MHCGSPDNSTQGTSTPPRPSAQHRDQHHPIQQLEEPFPLLPTQCSPVRVCSWAVAQEVQSVAEIVTTGALLALSTGCPKGGRQPSGSPSSAVSMASGSMAWLRHLFPQATQDAREPPRRVICSWIALRNCGLLLEAIDRLRRNSIGSLGVCLIERRQRPFLYDSVWCVV